MFTLVLNVPMQKDILMDKMKSSHVENHNMIEVRLHFITKQRKHLNESCLTCHTYYRVVQIDYIVFNHEKKFKFTINYFKYE